jgi:hypothetical protein
MPPNAKKEKKIGRGKANYIMLGANPTAHNNQNIP